MEEGGCGMNVILDIVLDLYHWTAFFFLGCFMCTHEADESRSDLVNALEALFFAAIWPVTLFAYFWQKLWTKGGRK